MVSDLSISSLVVVLSPFNINSRLVAIPMLGRDVDIALSPEPRVCIGDERNWTTPMSMAKFRVLK
jgi:hypothetical protein